MLVLLLFLESRAAREGKEAIVKRAVRWRCRPGRRHITGARPGEGKRASRLESNVLAKDDKARTDAFHASQERMAPYTAEETSGRDTQSWAATDRWAVGSVGQDPFSRDQTVSSDGHRVRHYGCVWTQQGPCPGHSEPTCPPGYLGRRSHRLANTAF